MASKKLSLATFPTQSYFDSAPNPSFSPKVPTQYRTNATFGTTFTGPVQSDRQAQDAARNQSMSQAAYSGQQRQYNTQRGQGVGAGSQMGAYRSAMQAATESGKAYAQAQQDMVNRMASSASADLQFQERLSGERNWVRDLLLDQKDVQSRERLAAYKRFSDVNLAAMERYVKEAQAEQRRMTTIMGALM